MQSLGTGHGDYLIAIGGDGVWNLSYAAVVLTTLIMTNDHMQPSMIMYDHEHYILPPVTPFITPA